MESTLLSISGSTELLPSTQALRPSFMTESSHLYLQYVTVVEADQIHTQFVNVGFEPGRQIMWTGVSRDRVQRWADANSMQTLTTVMGPLMDKNHPSCLKLDKTVEEWRAYVKGASALFALHVPKGDVVTVITRPPPQTCNPTGDSTYQTIEEPILKGEAGNEAVARINMLHLTVKGTEQYRYQIWPVDQTRKWFEELSRHLSKALSVAEDAKEKLKIQVEHRMLSENNKKEQRQLQEQRQARALKEKKEKDSLRKQMEQVGQAKLKEKRDVESRENEEKKRALKVKRRSEHEEKEKKSRKLKEERKKNHRERQEMQQAVKAKKKAENKRKATEQKENRKQVAREKQKRKKALKVLSKVDSGRKRIEGKRAACGVKTGKQGEVGGTGSLNGKVGTSKEGERDEVEDNGRVNVEQLREREAEREMDKRDNCTSMASVSYEGACEYGEAKHNGSKDSQRAEMNSEQVSKGRAVQNHDKVGRREWIRPTDELTEARNTSTQSETMAVGMGTSETSTTSPMGEGEHPESPQATCFSGRSDIRYRGAEQTLPSVEPRILVLRGRVIIYH